MNEEKIIDRRNRLIENSNTELKPYEPFYYLIEENINSINYLLYENKQLKEELETLKDDFDFNLGAIENIRKRKNELEERIDKAIEVLKEIEGCDAYIKEVLEILEDKE